MRSADPPARARGVPLIVAAVAAMLLGACQAAAASIEAPTATAQAATPAGDTAAGAVRPLVVSTAENAAPAPAAVSDLTVRWRDPGVAVVTWQEIPGRITDRQLVRQSAPFNGTCVSAPWRSDATLNLKAAVPQVVRRLAAGRCYRWTLTATDLLGNRSVIFSGPAFRPWAIGPVGWYPGERNRLWLPSLGIDQPIHHWSCTRSGTLADVVYSWGCAGSNTTTT